MRRHISARNAATAAGLVLLAGLFAFNYADYRAASTTPTDFVSCAAAGNLVMESYPRQCRAGEQLFVENIGNTLDMDAYIRVIQPRPNDAVVSSPLIVAGMARGSWFSSDGTFPISLGVASATPLASGVATAQAAWNTNEFVPFTATLSFVEGAASIAEVSFTSAGDVSHELRFPVRIFPAAPLPGEGNRGAKDSRAIELPPAGTSAATGTASTTAL